MNANNTLKVKLTRTARTHETRIILPAGATGIILGYRKDKAGCHWVLDFGLATVIDLPVESPLVRLIEVMSEEGK